MNSTPSNNNNNSSCDGSGKKIRKPYTITKSRESWSDEEHDKFIEALQLFDRDWKKIEDFVSSKTVIQIRSHAQKYFLKVQKNGTVAHVPPPRPKRKAAHPYPQKATKNVLIPPLAYPSSSLTSLVPGYPMWDEDSMIVDNLSSGAMSSENEYNFIGFEGDFEPKEAAKDSNCSGSGGACSPTVASGSELPKEGNQDSVLHGIPDFAEVYSFIGSVFDSDSKDHVHKLKEMDPINFETVLLLMKNLSVNLSSPDFEPIRKVLSSYDVGTDVGTETVEASAETITSTE